MAQQSDTSSIRVARYPGGARAAGFRGSVAGGGGGGGGLGSGGTATPEPAPPQQESGLRGITSATEYTGSGGGDGGVGASGNTPGTPSGTPGGEQTAENQDQGPTAPTSGIGGMIDNMVQTAINEPVGTAIDLAVPGPLGLANAAVKATTGLSIGRGVTALGRAIGNALGLNGDGNVGISATNDSADGTSGNATGAIGDNPGSSSTSGAPNSTGANGGTAVGPDADAQQNNDQGTTASPGVDASGNGPASDGVGGGPSSDGTGSGGDTSGTGDSASGPGGWAKGGVVTKKRLSGPNPKGPDDGYGALKAGEVVINPKAVKSYGKDVLLALNAGKIDPKAVKALLQKPAASSPLARMDRAR